MTNLKLRFVLLFAALSPACQGHIADVDGDGDGPVAPLPVFPSIDPDDPMPPAVSPPSAGDAPMARLTRLELQNTLGALYGEEAASLANDESEFAGSDLGDTSAVDAVAQFRLAESVAALVHESVVDCDPANRDACTEAIVREQGLRILRRPVGDERVARYVDVAARQDTFAGGVQVVLTALMSAPEFLYRIERGDEALGDGLHRPLTGYEIASKISYSVWRSSPDEALFAAAESGELSTAEGVRAHVLRALEDPRARPVLVNFHSWWLRLGAARGVFRDADDYPSFDPEDPERWIAQAEAFVEEALFDDEATLAELVRGGLLTQPAVVAGHAPDERTAAIYRGAFLYRDVLCGSLADPPADIPPLPEADPESSLRQQIEDSTEAVQPCVSCHNNINPLGFALEAFDGLGEVRDVDANGAPVDTNVVLYGPGDLEGAAVNSAEQLAEEIAESAVLRDCYVDRLFRYVSGRDVSPEDGYSRALAQYDFEVSSRNISELFASLLASDSFRYVRVPQ